jgi:uncharacterized membrane protein HdeD (DUF308 family)
MARALASTPAASKEDSKGNSMSTSTEPVRARNTLRTVLGISGIIAVIVGILILVWPGHTAVVVTAIIAIYAIIAGLVYAASGIFKAMSGWARVGHIVLGVIFIAAGVIAFTRLTATTAGLFIFVGILVGIIWIVEGIISLTTVSAARSKALTIIFAILSIIAGIVLLFSPLYSVILWLLIGASLLVLGIVQIVRALTWKTSD